MEASEASGTSGFVGSAVARYDVDELDDAGKKPRKEDVVEVRRPDGTIAKSRGERTFYGAFTGGFSAGYWNTVGSKAGWEPATFSSSREKRSRQSPLQVEDLMDDEDLIDHHSSHRTMESRGEFAARERSSKVGVLSASVPGGLPQQIQEDFFGVNEPLGSRLLAQAATEKSRTKASHCEPAQPTQPKKRYGCALPPAHNQAPSSGARPDSPLSPSSTTVKVDGMLQCLLAFSSNQEGTADKEARPSGARRWQNEVDLEKLWRSKAAAHGVGFRSADGHALASQLPPEQRLYMSRHTGKCFRSASYGDFGTGVLDMDERDEWEDIYDAIDKPAQYELALKDDDNIVDQQEERAAAQAVNGDLRGSIPGFVRSTSAADEYQSSFSSWYPPRVPRGYRGVRASNGSQVQEAQEGSPEHRALLEFLEKHGGGRMMEPAARAELLGERTEARGSQGGALVSAPDVASAAGSGSGPSLVSAAAPLPLWANVSEERREALVKSLGRGFIVGDNQDMDGNSVRREPFKNDPAKQQRFHSFSLAVEGKASAADALQASRELGVRECDDELAEFGRVYKLFRNEHSSADGAETIPPGCRNLAPVLCREVHTWVPERLLCKRWGVPEPVPDRATAQRERRGFARGGWDQAPDSAGIGHESTTMVEPKQSEPPRPPLPLFAAIFGDDESGDEAK